ncbi:VWA domain-containing protein [Psychrobium sp. MM17-31]|uniref:PilC/PilY family type IV pilus protein n=1 Tax=Psychrobium sp. MM17-31 TaxID=2917758 RepID=UPI001EF537F0|nr:PilC/PilY family type IV pilus protein [Psychrobium sp. MM17-31]MCG7530610.1 VWA domain-containing protein [Psychrobium sp. MM17-31]
MKRFSQLCTYFFIGLCLPLASVSPSHADDTEIFYLGDTVTPKVMMVLDTSGSMAFHVSNKRNRITVMKDALTQFINEANGINVGLMRTNQRTSAVVYPVSSLETSIQETVERFDRPITDDRNNAYQTSSAVYVRTSSDSSSYETFSFKDTKYIGLRFDNMIIPQGHQVEEVFLQVFPDHGCDGTWCGNFTLNIHGEKSPNSAQFDHNDNDNISSRPKTSASVAAYITNWEDSVRTEPYKLLNITPIVQEIVNQSDWKSGNALSLIFDTSSLNQSWHSRLGGFMSTRSLYFSPTLFVRVAPYNRTISTRQKLIEEMNNQRLTNYTPTVPALYEAVKYMTGSRVKSNHNSTLNTSRNGGNPNYIYNQLFERIPHADSYQYGQINRPQYCHENWLNDEACRQIYISESGGTLRYKTPLTDTCGDNEGQIVLLTDGEATHGYGAYDNNQWWRNMTYDISQTINNTNSACTQEGPSNRGYAQTCGTTLATKIKNGISVNGLTDQQKIKLYTIGFNNEDTWLQSMANHGGGQYKTATGTSDLLQVFKEIQADIIKEAVTFSNTSITLNSANQLNHNDNLYYALFTPNELSSWRGNLKHYKLSKSGNVVDVNRNVATNPTTGLFLDSAQSFWSATADGAQVTAGGAAERLQTISRNIYTNIGSGAALTKLVEGTNSTISASDFGLSSATDKEDHITWMLNNKNIADPLHSAPIEMSYGDAGSVIFFGDNQGYIHAIDATTGNELWAFIPKELLTKQPAIRLNAKSSNHIYGMDGNIVKWTEGGRKYIASGMRRGGRGYYALDVTDRNTPTLQWKITPDSSGFSQLGQTWSTPIKTKIKKGSGEKSVLIFGGGYDTKQDSVTTRTGDDVGDGIYIIDAVAGTIELSAKDLGYSIPSDIKTIDIDGDGTTDQLYVGDMGGRVLRADLDGSNKLNVDAIAEISGTSQSTNRRFYHAPDISVIEGTGGSTLAVAIGSGYHAHPNNTVIQDNFYMFKQPLAPEAKPTKITNSDLLPATLTIDNELLAAKKGWYLPLHSGGEKVLASSLTFESAVWFTTFQPSIGTNRCVVKRGTSRLYRVNISNGTPNYKKAIPTVVNGKVDESNSCTNTTCGETDRYVELQNGSIPPSPVLIHVNDPDDTSEGSGSVVCIGTYCKELPSRKSRMNFWREGP